MRNGIRINNVRFVAADSNAALKGLQGWISCNLNDRIQLDGITLRRSRGGRMILSFPARQDKDGQQHFYIRPLDDTARRVIERQVFQALDIRERSS